ncbi:hypothetical protein PPROV_000499500 [Pycnococcus provasolii]|uniref:ABC transmembrane type-1 domain-containing protein n=1 Tax=Pycnococcus provasolii TaxID=41880 RepID=A0A830HHC4_9CHLO|nr:hypothetical protein PPROV_000499500 [Pycnococcus provasolii]
MIFGSMGLTISCTTRYAASNALAAIPSHHAAGRAACAAIYAAAGADAAPFALSPLHSPAAKAVWVRLWHRLLRAPLAFHDASRAGRFGGVCTRDIFICDETLGTNWNIYLYTIATSLGMFALVCVIVPPYYRRTSRAMQRIEAVQRAPAYALLSEALAGVAPLRSAHLIRKCVKAMAACLWSALSSAIVAFAAFASVGFAISGSLTAGAAGLVVTNAIMTATQLEVEVNAVERIQGVSEEATPEVQTLRLMDGSTTTATTRASANVLRAKEELELDAWPADSSVRFRRHSTVIARLFE